MQRIRRQQSRKIRNYDKADGVDFVSCRICGEHLRVISGRHLSIHGTDRETYMEEYQLSPDQLCAKDFRRLHSSRQDYYPHGKRDWIAAIKKVHRQHGGRESINYLHRARSHQVTSNRHALGLGLD
jgi:hypothetical protein